VTGANIELPSSANHESQGFGVPSAIECAVSASVSAAACLSSTALG
jgi:hypothetical protein